jgi:hypothetical protein
LTSHHRSHSISNNNISISLSGTVA